VKQTWLQHTATRLQHIATHTILEVGLVVVKGDGCSCGIIGFSQSEDAMTATRLYMTATHTAIREASLVLIKGDDEDLVSDTYVLLHHHIYTTFCTPAALLRYSRRSASPVCVHPTPPRPPPLRGAPSCLARGVRRGSV